MRATLFALTASLTLVLAACESSASSGGASLAIQGRVWAAKEIGGNDVIDGTIVTLKIEGDRVSGKAGCNSYGGSVEINGDRLSFGSLFSTKMACMGGGVMQQEQRYLNLLQSVTRGEVRNDGALVLMGSVGEIEFRAD
jgi:heat shock protein HslJ